MWLQNYDPLHGALSPLVAALPLLLLLGLLGARKAPAHVAALVALAAAMTVAIGVVGMPAGMAVRAAVFGAAYGFLPIGWIVLNVIFLYRLTADKGVFTALQNTITRITTDRRLQLLLIAFCFGAFFEGAAGFGTPVAVTGAILIGIGFPPLEASVFSLIANTAPVAFGSLGTPIVALQGVTGLDLTSLSAMVGRQLPFFSVIVPFWLIAAYAGWKGMLEVWPALLVAGLGFAIPQFLVSNFHGPWLVDIVAAACSMVAVGVYLKASNRRQVPQGAEEKASLSPQAFSSTPSSPSLPSQASLRVALLPWIILTIIVFLWGLPQVKNFLNGISAPNIPIPGLDKLISRVPPVVPKPTPEGAALLVNWLSATGSGVLLAAIITGLTLGYSVRDLFRQYGQTLVVVWKSLLTISAMMALGYTTRYSGQDAILGLAFAHTGALYPFFGTLLGWMGVALTGSDTASNVLFGSLQKITATKLHFSPVLMAAANSSGGVMGKMIDAQSIVVASVATRWVGHEWKILRFVFWHSIALASLVGILVLLEQYVVPFSYLVLR